MSYFNNTMKNIRDYILEAYHNYRLNDVKVTYNVEPEDFYIEAPDTYQESDITMYLQDAVLNKMPSGQDTSSQFFGSNADNIYDVYFEYESFHRMGATGTHDASLEWDSRYDLKNTDEDVKLDLFKLIGLKYVIKFDRFDILNGSDDTVQETLETIFDATVSNDSNKYPITITLSHDNIEYSK